LRDKIGLLQALS